MLTLEQFARITQALPILRRAEPQLVRAFQALAFFTRIWAGKDVFVEGDQAEAIALLILVGTFTSSWFLAGLADLLPIL